MRCAITICRTREAVQQAVASWEAQNRDEWTLHVILPAEAEIDIAGLPLGPSVSVRSAETPLAEALAIAATCEIAWLLREGRHPESGSVAVIDHWFASRPAEVAFGDSVDDGGHVTIRPRYGRVRMLSTGDVGDSIVVRGSLAGRVQSSGSWHAVVMALIAEAQAVDHVPAVLDAGPTHPPITAAERATVLCPEDPQRILSDDGLHLIPGEQIGDETISIVIPSIGSAADIGGSEQPALLACLRSILARDTTLVGEIIIVSGPSMPASVIDEARRLAGDRLRVVDIKGKFNFSASCNLGAVHSTGSHILFLNDDVEVVTDDWLASMLSIALRDEVGAVGARLLFPDGLIQHCGITVRPDSCEPNHLYYRADPREVTDPSASACSEYLAVTGACLLISREDFDAVGGFSLSLPLNYNDVDLCLKLKVISKSSVSANPVTLIHRESTSRVPTITGSEVEAMERWRGVVQDDPYWYAWS